MLFSPLTLDGSQVDAENGNDACISPFISNIKRIVTSNLLIFLINIEFQADNFPFLGDYSSECLKTRRLFYQSLGRILLVDLGEDEEKFIEFMRPLTS